MQSKRLLTIILSGAMAMSVAAVAQTGNPSTSSDDTHSATTSPNRERGEKLAQELNLTPEQKTELKTLRENEKQQAQAIKNDSSLTPDQKKAKFQELRKSTHEQMMAKLTPEQQQKFKELRKEHRGHGRRGRKGQGAENTQG
jgi:Spy/CpxP family protein refolding chaperone